MDSKICKVCKGITTKYGKNSGRPVGGEDSYPVYENFMTKEKPGVKISQDDEVHARCQLRIRNYARLLPQRPPAKNPRKATSTQPDQQRGPSTSQQPEPPTFSPLTYPEPPRPPTVIPPTLPARGRSRKQLEAPISPISFPTKGISSPIPTKAASPLVMHVSPPTLPARGRSGKPGPIIPITFPTKGVAPPIPTKAVTPPIMHVSPPKLKVSQDRKLISLPEKPNPIVPPDKPPYGRKSINKRKSDEGGNVRLPGPSSQPGPSQLNVILHVDTGFYYDGTNETRKRLDNLRANGFVHQTYNTYLNEPDKKNIWGSTPKKTYVTTIGGQESRMLGLKAKEYIGKGDILDIYSGLIIPENIAQERLHNHIGAYIIDDGVRSIDAIDIGNEMRFINHWCQNYKTQFEGLVIDKNGKETRKSTYNEKIGEKRFAIVRALKPINPGEDITVSYAPKQIAMKRRYQLTDEDGKLIQCLCPSEQHAIGKRAVFRFRQTKNPKSSEKKEDNQILKDHITKALRKNVVDVCTPLVYQTINMTTTTETNNINRNNKLSVFVTNLLSQNTPNKLMECIKLSYRRTRSSYTEFIRRNGLNNEAYRDDSDSDDSAIEDQRRIIQQDLSTILNNSTRNSLMIPNSILNNDGNVENELKLNHQSLIPVSKSTQTESEIIFTEIDYQNTEMALESSSDDEIILVDLTIETDPIHSPYISHEHNYGKRQRYEYYEDKDSKDNVQTLNYDVDRNGSNSNHEIPILIDNVNRLPDMELESNEGMLMGVSEDVEINSSSEYNSLNEEIQTNTSEIPTKVKSNITLKNIKPFQCEMCGVSFTLKGNLKKHLIKHQSNKPTYACDQCHFSTIHQGALYNHIRNKHTLMYKSTK